MKCIIGLGNPGLEYQNTRHNAGFLALDALAKLWSFPEFSPGKHFGLESIGNIHGEKIILLKPTTFMNLSGKSVGSLLNFYKIPPKDILVLSDDIDQDFGKVRFRLKGSSGGQNGLKSIALALGTEDFARIKFGIGRNEHYNVSDWVLSKFSEEETKELQKIFTHELVKKVEDFLSTSSC